MHGLHSQDLVVALFIVKHRCREVVKHVLFSKRSIGLSREKHIESVNGPIARTNLYPFVPYEKPVTVVIWWMQIVYVHYIPTMTLVE